MKDKKTTDEEPFFLSNKLFWKFYYHETQRRLKFQKRFEAVLEETKRLRERVEAKDFSNHAEISDQIDKASNRQKFMEKILGQIFKNSELYHQKDDEELYSKIEGFDETELKDILDESQINKDTLDKQQLVQKDTQNFRYLVNQLGRVLNPSTLALVIFYQILLLLYVSPDLGTSFIIGVGGSLLLVVYLQVLDKKWKLNKHRQDFDYSLYTNYYRILKYRLNSPSIRLDDSNNDICIKNNYVKSNQIDNLSILSNTNPLIVKKRILHEFINNLSTNDYILQTKKDQLGFTLQSNYKINKIKFDVLMQHRDHRIINKILGTKISILDKMPGYESKPDDNLWLIKIYPKPITIEDIIELKESLTTFYNTKYSDSRWRVDKTYNLNYLGVFILGELTPELQDSLTLFHRDYEFDPFDSSLRLMIGMKVDDVLDIRTEKGDSLGDINLVFPTFAIDSDTSSFLIQKADKDSFTYYRHHTGTPPQFNTIFSVPEVLEKNFLQNFNNYSTDTSDIEIKKSNIIKFGSFLPTVDADFVNFHRNKITFLIFDYILSNLDINPNKQYENLEGHIYSSDDIPEKLKNTGWEELLKPSVKINFDDVVNFIFSRLSIGDETEYLQITRKYSLIPAYFSFLEVEKNYVEPLIEEILLEWEEYDIIKINYEKNPSERWNEENGTTKKEIHNRINSIIVSRDFIFNEEFSSINFTKEIDSV